MTEKDDFIVFDTNPTATKVSSGKVLSLVEENNPILKMIMPLFDFSDKSVNPKKISEDLIATLKAHRALGIAAPQCDLAYRVFVVGAEDNYITMFNPEIISVSEKTAHMPEYCLSFPFLELNVTRPESITVRYQDINGNTLTESFSGITARCIQHETNHLDGVTFNTLAKPLALKNGLKKREKYIKQFARQMVAQRRMTNEIPR